MQYNVDFELTSLIFVLFIFACSCMFYPIQSDRNKLFRSMSLVLILTELVDIVTALMINYSVSVPLWLNMFMNSLYFAGGAVLCYMFSAYTDSYFLSTNGRTLLQKTKVGVLVFVESCVVLNLFTGILFYFDENGQYTHGPLYYMVYAGVFFSILVAVISTIANFKVINKSMKIFIGLFFMVFLTPTILQMVFFQNTLLVIFGASLGLLVNFFFLESPDYAKLTDALDELNNAQVRLEQNNIQLQKEKNRADEASKAKSVFLANMSHEIRTPINAVLGMDTMILREAKDEQIRKYARDIQSAGRNLLSLVNDILDFTKIESGKMEPIFADYEFVQMIDDLENMIRPRMEMKGLEFEVNVDETISSRFYGDDFRITQILTNLLTNAVKYTPKGKVVMEVKKIGQGQNGLVDAPVLTETLLFSIADTGIGIKEEDIDKLTDEFVRIDQTKNRNIEGTGLGINIVVSLLKMLGSKLDVKSTYGEGSVFSFYLEQQVTNSDPIGNIKDRIESTQIMEEYSVPFCAPEARLLIVDDNAMNRNVFLGLVRELQCVVDEAESGMRCLELVQENKYDLIFMDHMMPIMDGVETLHHMRELGDYLNADTPVVVLTANAVMGARKEYLKEGFVEYLTKPVNADSLEKLIGHMIPENKKISVSDSAFGAVDTKKATEEIIDWPVLDGVDFESALNKLKKQQVLMQAIQGFSKMAKMELDLLCKLYQELPDEAALNDYRIKVHSMKSTAAMIGANHVSGLAKYLEYAAKEADLDTIHQLMPTFSKEWLKLQKAVDEAFGYGAASDENQSNSDGKPVLEKQELKQCLSILAAAMDVLDVDSADVVMEELNKYHYQEAEQLLLEQLAAHVINMDKYGCMEVIDKWTKLL